MEPNGLVEGLKALARDEAQRPGGRARMAAALRAALAEVEDPGMTGIAVALDGLVEHLMAASDHAEFLQDAWVVIRRRPPEH